MDEWLKNWVDELDEEYERIEADKRKQSSRRFASWTWVNTLKRKV